MRFQRKNVRYYHSQTYECIVWNNTKKTHICVFSCLFSAFVGRSIHPQFFGSSLSPYDIGRNIYKTFDQNIHGDENADNFFPGASLRLKLQFLNCNIVENISSFKKNGKIKAFIEKKHVQSILHGKEIGCFVPTVGSCSDLWKK